MRILIVSIYAPGSETGVAVVSETLSKSLAECGHEIMYLCVGESWSKKSVSKGVTYLQIPSIAIKQGFAPRLTNKTVNTIYKELDEFKPDIIHAQNMVLVALTALVWAKKNKVPYILTLHSQPSQGANYISPKITGGKEVPVKYSPTKQYLKRYLEACDLVISLNNSIDKSVRDLSKTAKVKRIQNGLPLKKYFDMPEKVQGNTLYFLYLGMYMPRKNQEFLVKAFSHLPKNYKLLLHGNKKTGGDYVKKLQKIKSDSGASNVKIGGFIKGWSYNHTMKKADYLVSASLQEVQSLSIIEALASGTPVIGLSNETINEMITKDNGLKLSKDINPEEFAKKLKAYVEKNKTNYSKTSKSARKSVKNYDIESVTKEMVRTYKKTIKTYKPETLKKNKNTKLKNGRLQIDLWIDQLVPTTFRKQFKELAYKPIVKPLDKEKFWLKWYMGVTVILAMLIWPIAKAYSKIKSN